MYGANDELVAASTVDEAQSRNQHGQWLLYEGAGHGFMDLTADGYEPSAAGDAIQRMIAFFKATLPAAEVEELG
jgi:dienelactone hydrolase